MEEENEANHGRPAFCALLPERGPCVMLTTRLTALATLVWCNVKARESYDKHVFQPSYTIVVQFGTVQFDAGQFGTKIIKADKLAPR